MTPDSELLRQYVKDGSQAAFAEIVKRHLDLVYSAALRLVWADRHLAQDVTQGVFTDLARHAPRLLSHPTLVGWLHTTTHYAAAKIRRTESRRRAREQEAFAMQDHAIMPEIYWEQLRPVLDEAVNQLKPQDRDAVLLRYFEGKTHREIGGALGMKEDAARLRVDRALEKLRGHFARRGLNASATILAGLLAGNAVHAAPAGLASGVTGTALASGGGLLNFLLKAFFMSTKTKIAAATAAVVAIIAAVPLEIQSRANDRLREEIASSEHNLAALQASTPDQTLALAAQMPTGLTTNQAAPDSLEVQVNRAILDKMQFNSLDAKLSLTEEVRELLQITSEEAAGLQKLLGDFKQTILDNALGHMRELTPEDPAVRNWVNSLTEKSEKISLFSIPGYPKDEMLALQTQFKQNLDSILGPERGAVFESHAKTYFNSLVNGPEDRVIGFNDYVDANGIPQTGYMYRYHGNSGSGTLLKLIPPEYEFLLNAIRQKHSPPAP